MLGALLAAPGAQPVWFAIPETGCYDARRPMRFSVLQYAIWLAGTLALVACLTLLTLRRLYGRLPLFTVYIAATLLGDLLGWWLYHRLPANSSALFYFYWGGEAVLVALRGLVIAEICHRLLGPYRGVWGLSKRILLALALLVLAVGVLSTWGATYWIAPLILTAKRGVELAAVSVLVGLVLLCRFYEIRIPRLEGILALGLGIYSAIEVVNRTLMREWIESIFSQWSSSGPAAFVLALYIWLFALWRPAEAAEVAPGRLVEEEYRRLSPAVNERLRALNARLEELLRG